MPSHLAHTIHFSATEGVTPQPECLKGLVSETEYETRTAALYNRFEKHCWVRGLRNLQIFAVLFTVLVVRLFVLPPLPREFN